MPPNSGLSNVSLPALGHRYLSLDIWRGLACLMIALVHSTYMIHHGNRASYPTFWASPEGTVYGIICLGSVRVPVFFVISGFCISTICDRLRRGPRPAQVFLYRRFHRIFPTYWGHLVLSMAIVLLMRPLGWFDQAEAMPDQYFNLTSLSLWGWFGNLSLMGNWQDAIGLGPSLLGPDAHTNLFFGHLWTLCVEFQFYLICGLVLLLLPRRFFVAIAALTLIFLIRMRFWMIIPDRNWLCFALGSLLYCQLTYFSPRLSRLTSLAFLTAGLGLLLLRQAQVRLAISLPFSPASLIFASGLGFLRPYDRALATARVLQPLMRLGKVSYSVYLWHLLTCWLVLLALEPMVGADVWTGILVKLPCMAAASILVGWLFYHGVECRFLNHATVTSRSPAADAKIALAGGRIALGDGERPVRVAM
jgi:peptidoglycan/LPS O-acetylase OafA/YrhL